MNGAVQGHVEQLFFACLAKSSEWRKSEGWSKDADAVQTGVMPVPVEPQPAERWAYRARRIDDLVEVEVVKTGTQRPARVQVRFVEERFEGRQEWVPPARLKVRWSAVGEFLHREALWDRIAELGIGEDPRRSAAEQVFDTLIDSAIARMEYNNSGCAWVIDSGRLAAVTALDPALWLTCAEAFHDGPELVVPWPITEKIAQSAAERQPNPLLEIVERDEAEARREAVHGRYYPGRGSRPGFSVSAESCIRGDNEYGKPVREVLRRWCGADATERFDELVALRAEIRRVGLVAEEAIAALRDSGQKRDAERLAHALGIPVQALRTGR